MSFKEANEKIKETAERLAYSQQVRYYSDRLQEKLNRARQEIAINRHLQRVAALEHAYNVSFALSKFFKAYFN